MLHPDDRTQLVRLARGELPPGEAEELAAKFATEESLADLARSLSGDDTLLGSLKNHEPGSDASLADQFIGRIRAVIDRDGQTLAALAEDADDEEVTPPPPETLEYYRIVRTLGEGGMGTVYLAEDTRLGRQVAIKTLKRELAVKPKAKERFFREARAAARLEHDHIIPIYYVGESAGIPFLAMPFLKGAALDETLKTLKRPMPMPEVIRIGREVALGLAVAHEAGLIHRDIKPANIWLEAPHGRVKILDFGLARTQAEEGHLTASGIIMGTPAYMAPEQARGKPVDARADLFSLGVMLYELSTGKKPFTGPDMMSILTSLALDEPPAANVVNPAVPPRLSNLIERLMAKEPGRRPMTAQVVADELLQAAMITSQPTFELLPEVPPPPTAPADPWGGIEETAALPVSPASKAPARPEAAKKWLLPAVSLLGLLVIVGVIIVLASGKGGKTPDEGVTDKGKVEVVETSKPVPEKEPKFKPLPVVALPSTSSFDQLDPAKIPAAEKGPWLPPSAVGVLGTRTGKNSHYVAWLDVTPDGKLIATVTLRGELRLTDATAGKEIAVVRVPDVQGRVSISSDGKKLALLCADTLRLFAHADGMLKPDGELVGKWKAYARSADGSRALLSLHDGRTQLWDLTGKPKQLAETAEAHDGAANHPVFLKGGEWFATTGADKLVRVWDSATGKKLHQFGPYNEVRRLHAVRGGKELIVVTQWQDFHRWSFEGAVPQERKIVLALETPAQDSSVDAEGRTIALSLARVGGTVEVWPIDGSGKEALTILPFLNTPPVWLAPDGKTLMFGAYWTNSVAAADLGGVTRPRLVVPGTRHLTPVVVTAAGDVLALSAEGIDPPQGAWFAVKNGAFAPREPDQRINLASFPPERTVAAVTPESRRVFTVAADLVNYDKYDLTAQPDAIPERQFHSERYQGLVAMSADESTHAVLAEDAQIRILKRGRGGELTENARLDVNLSGVPRMRLAPDGRAVYVQDAIGQGRWRLRAWDLTGAKPREIKTPPEWAEMQLFDLSADGRRLAVYTMSSVVTWDMTGPAPKVLRRRENIGSLGFYDLLLSNDGRYLLFGANNGGLPDCHYTVTDTTDGKVALSFDLPFPVRRLQFSPESRHVIAALGNGTACVLRIAEADPDRVAAEYVLSVGGTVHLDGLQKAYKSADELPPTKFKLTSIKLQQNALVSDAGLEAVRGCKNLAHVYMTGTKVTDQGLRWFKDCESLRAVGLDYNQLTDAGLEHFKNRRGMTSLSLIGTKITDRGLRLFDGNTTLTVLNLTGTDVSDDGVAAFKNSAQLTVLALEGTRVTEQTLVTFADCKDLFDLRLSGKQFTDASVPRIVHFKKLRTLWLNYCPVTDEGLATLEVCEGLKFLEVVKTNVTRAGIDRFRKQFPLCQVKWDGGVLEPLGDPERKGAEYVLSVGGTVRVNWNATDIRRPADLPAGAFQLTEVYLDGSKQVSDDGLAALAGCKHLTVLYMNNTPLTDKGMAHLTGFQNLRKLSLANGPVSDAGLAAFKGCNQLTHLYINNTRATDAGVLLFKDCVNLDVLSVPGTTVTKAGLGWLKNREKLTHLVLDNTPAGDAEVELCNSLPGLKLLSLNNTRVTDAGADHLKPLRKLTNLNLKNTKISAAKIGELKTALPNCRIEWDGRVIEPAGK